MSNKHMSYINLDAVMGIDYPERAEKILSTADVAAMGARIAALEAEVKRLRALLTAADINTESYPQEVRNREIERDRVWFEKEQIIQQLTDALETMAGLDVVPVEARI